MLINLYDFFILIKKKFPATVLIYVVWIFKCSFFVNVIGKYGIYLFYFNFDNGCYTVLNSDK